MFRFAAMASTILLAPSGATWADTARAVLDLSQSYRSCAASGDDAQRLNCYEALSPKIIAVTESVTADISQPCIIEDWNYSRKAGAAYITGATSCASGRLNYRLYDGEKFLVSGFTYIKGFAFQAYADAPSLPEMQIKYSIE